jgi:hypothetical protein
VIHRTKLMAAVVLVAGLTLLPVAASAQIAAGQTSNFEDGSTQGWLINLLGGLPAPIGQPVAPAAAFPVNVPTGGPAGANDNYLRLTALGTDGPGGRLMVLNPGAWGGNWLAAGITSVRMDAINLGNTELRLRFGLEDAMGAPPTNFAVSTAITLAAGSGWQSLEFPLFGPNGLTAFLGTVNATLTNATIMRIYHSPAAADNGPPIVASLGLDNITALARTVPEPSTFLLLGAGGLGLMLLRRRSTR